MTYNDVDFSPTLALHCRDSFIDIEFLRKAQALGWRIEEVGMRYRPRQGGKSATTYRTMLQFLRNMLRYRLGSEFQRCREEVRTPHS